MSHTIYNLGFTAATLRPEICRIVAEVHLEQLSWQDTKARIIENNLLQCDSKGTLSRLEREFRGRLACLTHLQLKLLAGGVTENRVAMSWLAATKRYTLIRDFTVQVLREKLTNADTAVRPSDYSSFIEAAAADHPEIESISSSSRKKVKSRVFTMLKEAGLLVQVGRTLMVRRPVLPALCRDAVLQDHDQYLACYLWSDAEIEAAREGH